MPLAATSYTPTHATMTAQGDAGTAQAALPYDQLLNMVMQRRAQQQAQQQAQHFLAASGQLTAQRAAADREAYERARAGEAAKRQAQREGRMEREHQEDRASQKVAAARAAQMQQQRDRFEGAKMSAAMRPPPMRMVSGPQIIGGYMPDVNAMSGIQREIFLPQGSKQEASESDVTRARQSAEGDADYARRSHMLATRTSPEQMERQEAADRAEQAERAAYGQQRAKEDSRRRQ